MGIARKEALEQSVEASGAFNRSVLIPATLDMGHHRAMPSSAKYCLCLAGQDLLSRHINELFSAANLKTQFPVNPVWIWALRRKPHGGPSPAGLFAGCFPWRDSCQFPAPTAGKGPVSLHCPWDFYCLVTELGSGWQELSLQAAGRNWCPQPGRTSGRGKAGSWAMLTAAGDPAPRAPWGHGDSWREVAVQCRGWASLSIPALSAWGGLSHPHCPLGSCRVPAPPCWCPSVHPGCSAAPALRQEHQRGQGPHMKEKCLLPPHARNICPQGVCARGHGRFCICCFSGMGPQMCIQPSP